MKISIFGLGYVGAVSLACLARDGHSVIGVDVDMAKLDLIREGRTPVVEEGMVDLMERGVRRLQLCLTHLHLDHLEGLRFFAPLWDERVVLDIWGPPSHLLSLRERIARSFSPPLFPVELRDVPASVTFHARSCTPSPCARTCAVTGDSGSSPAVTTRRMPPCSST